MHTASRMMFLLLPVFAWFASIAARARRNFPQHLYFALQVHAAWFAAWLLREVGAVLLSPRVMNSTRWLGHLMLVYSGVYVVLAFRRAYQEPFWRAALKMCAVGAAYVVLFLAIVAVASLTPAPGP